MSGLLNELESYDEVHRAIAAGEPRSWFEDERVRMREKEARIQFLEGKGLTRSDAQGVVMAEDMRGRKHEFVELVYPSRVLAACRANAKRAKLNVLIEAKKEELAPYDKAGITSKYTDDKASRLRKELQALRVRLGKACKVPPLRRSK